MGRPLSPGSAALERGGTIVAYEVRGTGPAAIVVPYLEGWDRVALRIVFRPLERILTLVYVDPPGVGRSGPPVTPEDRTAARIVRDLEAIRIRLGLQRTGLVAHGSGGRVGLIYAAGHPAGTCFAVLTGVSAANEFEAGDPSAFDREDVAVAWNAARRQPTNEAFWAWHRAMASLEPASAGLRRALGRVERESAGIDPARLPISERELQELDARPLLRLISAPSIAIAGGRDAVVPARLQRNLAHALPHADYVEFPRSGHYPMVQERDRSLSRVRTFVRRVVAD